MNAVVVDSDNDAGAFYMSSLRRDHAGLSRVLRLIDALAERLLDDAEQARPILLDALRYLLEYHHTHHHPREDRLFARIRARQPAVAETLDRIGHEHESGEQEIARLHADLSAGDARRLAGKHGARLAKRISDYVQHARIHMRDEEVVFYARAEDVLTEADWRDIIEPDGPQDPLASPPELAELYPWLAEQLTLVSGESRGQPSSIDQEYEIHRQLLALTDLYGGLLHEGLELSRGHVQRLAAIRSPGALVRAVSDISTDNLRFAGHCVARPSRWAVNAGCGLLLGWLRPHLPDS
ncbi:MAG: hemerythrin domain-containing protein [Wenzhouxiangella sp.]|nr:hemerythrin domain-containing protein [Wenzhouxiangella sp.]